MSRKTGEKATKETKFLSYKKRLRDTGENPKKLNQCASGYERTEHRKTCGQKEEQER